MSNAPLATDKLTRRDLPAVLVPALFYLLALNPYFLPEVYDDVMYFGAAEMLLDHGRLEFVGERIVRWPPGFFMMLAGLFALELRSVLWAKLLVLACVVGSGFLLLALLRRERASYPRLRVFGFLLLPQALLSGTRIMAEFPFFVLALSFLLLLPRCERGPRRYAWAVVVGGLLGAASLTRWLGVPLGAGLVWQALGKLRRREGVRSIGPEALAASLGAAMCVAQLLHSGATLEVLAVPEAVPTTLPASAPARLHELVAQAADETAPREDTGEFTWVLPGWLRAGDRMANVIVNHVPLLKRTDLHRRPWIRGSFLPVAAVLLLGVLLRLRRGAFTPADAYTMATIVVLQVVGWDPMRYWVPVAPFLIGYLFEVFEWVAVRVTQARARVAGAVLFGAWIASLVVADAALLFRGNGYKHGGLSILASPTAERFYRGRWADLYAVVSRARRDPSLLPLGIWGEPGAVQYVEAFTGMPGQYFPPRRPIGSLIALPDRTIPAADQAPLGLREIAQRGPYTLYRVSPHSPLNFLHAR